MARIEPTGDIKKFDNGVEVYKAKLIYDDLAIDYPVSVRSVPVDLVEVLNIEERYFGKARNEAGKGVLPGVRTLEQDNRQLFIYEQFDYDLEKFAKSLVQPVIRTDGEMEINLKLVIRRILYLLHKLHYELRVVHGNLIGHLTKECNIVISEPRNGEFLVRLSCFGGEQDDCNDLYELLSRITVPADPVPIPSWFDTIMNSLWNRSIRNLYNSLGLLTAKQKFEYFWRADDMVENLPLVKKHLNGAFPRKAWINEVQKDSNFLKVLENEGKGRIPRDEKASTFLHFCRNLTFHYKEYKGKKVVSKKYKGKKVVYPKDDAAVYKKL
ncbi:unnamed protein product [Linum trigynum]|uniref:Uncharacterized protein n=1 Tax=Linum trigynum TaxID=586398 RepID=A0AAV2CFT2_9ROSI